MCSARAVSPSFTPGADPAVWGRSFPLQYEAYRRTLDQVRTRFGGSEARARTPTSADPRSVVAQSKLEEDPRLVAMWEGYLFALDFREERGHAYMLEDQTFTGRQQRPQPGSCLNGHASFYLAYKQAGAGDIQKGFDRIHALPFAEARRQVEHPMACIDGHTAETLALRITRPAFIDAIRTLKAAQGVADFEVTRDATRQEMRTWVCAQCHMEYDFQGAEKHLVFPWTKGLNVEDILAYYDEIGHKDWQHTATGTTALKAQHPELEMWSQGIHSRSGVVCADCHMPYHRVGAHKISDHHVRSPLLNLNNACQTCHKWPEHELLDRVETIQNRTAALRNLAMDALIDLINALKAARAAGAAAARIARAQNFQRKAQF